MDKRSLKHEACARQLHSKKPEISQENMLNSGALSDMLQAMTFSITFTASEWGLFWRLLNVGCMLADEYLDLLTHSNQTASPDSALLWNELSAKLAAVLQHPDTIKVMRQEELETFV